jgi:hypothetical protein
VEKIAQAARAGKSLGVNAQNPLTAKMYVIWACDIRPRDAWHIAAVDGITGERAEQDLEDQIRSTLSQVLGVDEEEVDDVLQVMLEEEEPVFIALPTQGIENKTLAALKAKFQGVTFFLLMGDHIPSKAALSRANIEFLEPKLNQSDEVYYCSTYDKKKKYLMVGV